MIDSYAKNKSAKEELNNIFLNYKKTLKSKTK